MLSLLSNGRFPVKRGMDKEGAILRNVQNRSCVQAAYLAACTRFFTK
jgi:hypothetical protein